MIIAFTEIKRAVKLIVTCHGDDALIHAAMRANEMLAAGNFDGLAVWTRVWVAIDRLLKNHPQSK